MTAYEMRISDWGSDVGASDLDAWTSGPLSTVDEAKVIGGFSTALTPADQDARMDMLLWQGATGAAQSQLAFVSPANRAVFAARLAFQTNSSNAAVLAGSVSDIKRYDPDFIADSASWLRDNPPRDRESNRLYHIT